MQEIYMAACARHFMKTNFTEDPPDHVRRGRTLGECMAKTRHKDPVRFCRAIGRNSGGCSFFGPKGNHLRGAGVLQTVDYGAPLGHPGLCTTQRKGKQEVGDKTRDFLAAAFFQLTGLHKGEHPRGGAKDCAAGASGARPLSLTL